MSIEKYDYSMLHESLISGLNTFLTPLWDWAKIKKSENLNYIYDSNEPYIEFYIDDKTSIYFALGKSDSSHSNMMFWINTDNKFFTGRIDYHYGSAYEINTNKIARIRFTKVGTKGFFIGFDCYYNNNRVGDYTIPLIMCCDVGGKYALIHNGLVVPSSGSLTMPSTTNNKMFYDDMMEMDTVSLTRRVTDSFEQLVPVCTNTGLYSANGFTPAITYNNTLTPQKFTLGGKQYYGNGLMVLLDE